MRSYISVCILAVFPPSAVGFNADEILSSVGQSMPSISKDDGQHDLFSWAKHQGAKIADSIEVKSTAYGGRGLFAKRHIPANTELIQIPYHLQLGARQLAQGSDIEMQTMARHLPWRYIMEHELFFIPLGIALLAEKRKGAASKFWPFLQSLPLCSNAVAEGSDGELSSLSIWAPDIASNIRQRRRGLKEIHNTIAPSSLSIEELRWAAANVCSRSLIRKRIKELSSKDVDKIGAFCASDHSRMLPIIDLVNHGSLSEANVWVGHLSRSETDNNDFSTSLKSIRDIAQGQELLFDYGGKQGQTINNARLLLDYGFVLPQHINRVSISLEEFTAAISEMFDRDRLRDAEATQIKGLHSLTKALMQQASIEQNNMPIVFGKNCEPTILTHAIAICMTCRDKGEISCLVKLFEDAQCQRIDVGLLPSQITNGCSNIQKEYARYSLKIAAAFALAQRTSITVKDHNKEQNVFEAICEQYSKMCYELLQRVSDLSI